MKIRTFEEVFGHKPTIQEIANGFVEDTKTGSVKAFGGLLEVRPPYQREFVYGDDKQKAVVDTILNDCPLNVMYWALAPDGQSYEMLDGQQRTISFCRFVQDKFSVAASVGGENKPKTFTGLPENIRDDVSGYDKLLIYICDGTEDEKLTWFRKINVAGIPLTEQEMRNAVYASRWTTDAKHYFSRIDGYGFDSEGHVSNGHTYGDYLNVVGGNKSEKENAVVRQRLLEIVLEWAVDSYNKQYGRKITVDEYMESHVKDADAKELWRYYEDVMEWVKATFPTYRACMKGVEWGTLYNKYGKMTPVDADKKVNDIFSMAEAEISNPRGVYEAVLSGSIKFIHARAFDDKDKKKAYTKQGGICPYCHKHFEYDEMQGDHIKPWSKGGATEIDNLQMLCAECNGKKSGYDTGFAPWDGKAYEAFDIDKWDIMH